jgi:hypothetical protein
MPVFGTHPLTGGQRSDEALVEASRRLAPDILHARIGWDLGVLEQQTQASVLASQPLMVDHHAYLLSYRQVARRGLQQQGLNEVGHGVKSHGF